MTMWEFHLELDDGTALSQTVLAEGASEADASASAASLVNISTGVFISIGKIVPLEVEIRWREVCGDVFPLIVSDAGRFALYARGNKDSS